MENRFRRLAKRIAYFCSVNLSAEADLTRAIAENLSGKIQSLKKHIDNIRNRINRLTLRMNELSKELLALENPI